MNVLILLPSTQSETTKPLIERIIGGGFSTSSCVPAFLSDTELLANLQTATHFVFILDTWCFTEPGFLFAAGYSLGGKHPVFLYNPGSLRIPAYFGQAVQSRDTDALITLLGEERILWKRKLEISEARAMLEAEDISLTTEALFRSISDGDTRVAELFFRAGFSPNLKDAKGVPLLSCAVRNRHRFFIPILLGRGAEINAVSGDRGNTALMDACADGDEDIARDLIGAGAEVDTKSKNGQTALILAVGKGNTRIASMLIEAGADPEVKDSLGMSAKKYAQLFNLTEVVRVIERTGSKA